MPIPNGRIGHNLATLAVIVVLLSALPNHAEGQLLGKIDFPTSGAQDAKPAFMRGVLYIHSFEICSRGSRVSTSAGNRLGLRYGLLG